MGPLKPSEQRLVFITGLALVFLIGWNAFLWPALTAVNKIKTELSAARQQFDLLISKPRLASYAERKYAVYPQEAQLNHIMNFLDDKFRWHGIKLVSLKQSFSGHKLTIDLQFESTYGQLNGFLNGLEKIETLLVVDQAKVVQRGNRVVVDLRLLSGYL